MLIKLKNSLIDIKRSKEFKIWKEKHPKSYLSSVFNSTGHWQIDFYCPKDDNMTSFTTKNDKIIVESSEIFRKEKRDIKELKLEEVKIGINKAKEIISNLVNEKYPGEETTKEIFILQNTENPIWNITYITKTMNIIHIRINALSGTILKEKKESALSFKR